MAGIGRGKVVPLKDVVDNAIQNLNFVDHVVVFQRTNSRHFHVHKGQILE